MAIVEDLLHSEADETISFGNHERAEKGKLEDYAFAGDLYKVKTYQEITKLEKNGSFLYESVPGTSVNGFKETAEGVTFTVEGADSAQITLGLEDDASYDVTIGDRQLGTMQTNMGGKLNISVVFDKAPVRVQIVKK